MLDVEHGTFTPLIFGTNGGLGKECSDFIKNIALKIAEQQDEKFGIVMSCLRTKLYYEPTMILLIGMCISLTKKTMKPIIANPMAVAIAIFWNSRINKNLQLLVNSSSTEGWGVEL